MEFPPTLCINLAKRVDRLELLQKEFVKWPVPVERVEAITATSGWEGCTLSHRKCIQIAKDRNYPWVLILEDDCKLTEDGMERFTSLLPTLWEKRNEFDVFIGGPIFFTREILRSVVPPLIELNGKTTHFCLIPSHKYDQVLRDIQMTYAVFVIDHYYCRNFRVWVTYPHLAIQYESKSDIRNKENKSVTIFGDAEKLLLEFIKTGEQVYHIEEYDLERWKDLDIA